MLSCSSRLSQIAQGSSNAHACLSSPKLSSRSRSETQGVPHKASDAFKGCMSVIRSKERLFAALSGPTSSAQTYEDFLSQQGNENLSAVLLAFKDAVKEIAGEISGAALHGLHGQHDAAPSSAGRDEPKKLDVLANEIMKSRLSSTGSIAAMASEEDEDVVSVECTASDKYVAVFDPLDGSSNIDACIPTGTILGLYPYRGSALESALQPGSNQIAAAYALYSSATMLIVSLGEGVQGFTLDSASQEFYLTHRIQIPARGQMYSLNDARQFDWPAGLRSYIDTIRQGKGQSGKQYSARYICSLVADFHRTLLYGGWAGNPRNHLRLVYEANPLSFLAEKAGGRGSSGTQQILGMQPQSLHERIPVFLGSPDDIAELESYGNVQQLGHKKYSA